MNCPRQVFEPDHFSDRLFRIKLEAEKLVLTRIKRRLDRGHHERRMGCRQDLHLNAGRQMFGDTEDRGQDRSLPARMKMGFDFIDDEHDLVGRFFLSQFGRLQRFDPGPDNQVRETDHTFDPCGPMRIRDGAVGHFQCGKLAAVIHKHFGGGDAFDRFQRMRKQVNHLDQRLKRIDFGVTHLQVEPFVPVGDQTIAKHPSPFFQPVGDIAANGAGFLGMLVVIGRRLGGELKRAGPLPLWGSGVAPVVPSRVPDDKAAINTGVDHQSRHRRSPPLATPRL